MLSIACINTGVFMRKRWVFVFSIFLNSYSGVHRNLYLTIEMFADGFGSQYQSLLSAIAIANYLDIEFVYKPIKSIAHNYNDDSNFVDKLVDFTGIRNSFKTVDQLPADILIKEVYKLEDIIHIDNVLYVIKDCAKQIVDANPDILYRSKECLRKIYLSSSKPKLKGFNGNCFNVSVHVRRRNVMDDRGRESFLFNDYYFSVMSNICKKYPNALFHIYSQADPKICDNSSIVPHGFEGFDKYNCIFHLDESVEETFHGMVMADALIMCDSSLSYATAILSEGEVYYHRFWHAPIPGWNVIELDKKCLI